MQKNALLIGFLVVAMALAGCASGGGPPTDDGEDPVGPVVTDDTGAISGVVLDDEGLPVASAQIALSQDLSNVVRADQGGRFVFSELAPGPYDILVTAIAHESASKRVEVLAGQVTEVEIRLVAAAVEGVPKVVAMGPIPGGFFCAFAAGVAGPCKAIGWGPDHPVEEVWGGVSDNERNIFQFPAAIEGNRTADSDVLKTLVVEVTWEPVSASADTLQATVERIPDDGGRNITPIEYGYARGGDPLRIRVDPGIQGDGANAAMPDSLAGFTIGVFPAGGEDVPVSVYTSQKFEIWFTLFYNAPAQLEFTALPDV